MKKTLFSLAFVAASGAYVAAANHLFALPDHDEPALAKQIAAPVAAPVAPAASIISLAASSELPSNPPAPVVAEIAPVVRPTPVAVAPTASAVTVAEAPPKPMPPLPRPRPNPPATVQAAASIDGAASTGGGYRDGTYTGAIENAYYGDVQVQVTVANHAIASIKVLSYPNDRRTSRYINSQALPMLHQEVIAADSANVDTISGATLTSEAYIRSLGTALQQAGAAGA